MTLLQNPLVYNALIVGVSVAIAAALLGVVLVLGNHSLIGHGLADVGFASSALGLALGWSPFAVSIPLVAGASVLILYLSRHKRIGGDAAIGMVATTALATGVIITKVSGGFNMDVYNYMFGSLMALRSEDVVLALCLLAVVAGAFLLLYNRLFLLCYDENHASACGLSMNLYRTLLSVLTGLAVVVGMRLMGALLISSLMVFPPVTARRLSRSFRGMMGLSALAALLGVCGGIGLSFALDWPAGASIAAVNAVLLGLGSLAARLTGSRKASAAQPS